MYDLRVLNIEQPVAIPEELSVETDVKSSRPLRFFGAERLVPCAGVPNI